MTKSVNNVKSVSVSVINAVNALDVCEESKEMTLRMVKYGLNAILMQLGNRLPGENLGKHACNIFIHIAFQIDANKHYIWIEGNRFGDWTPTEYAFNRAKAYIDFVLSSRK